ncbi:MAG TPA: glycosyl transferase [Micromonosporaceae bacterium]|nr:glycosyl transferase [Micromonosporaceae bacterium]HCU48557.1 glycosyl transferase [Micromonosporaceae bacterium]
MPAPFGTVAGRWLFAGPADTVDSALYATVARGSVLRRRTEATLAPGTKVSGNTFFGRFPATYWQRWTNVREVRVQLTVTGGGRVSIAASDLGGFARVVATKAVVARDREPVVLAASVDRFIDGGALWLELESADGSAMTVADVRWTVPAPAAARITTLSFCTINRPDFCVGILRALAADQLVLDRLDRILVVDQGSEPLAAFGGYQSVAADLGDRLRYVAQPNLGAAGGVNRSLYEVAGQPPNGPANVLFLDDDVLLEPEVVIRLTTFGDHLTQPMIIGGQMLNIFHPHVLLADAQRTDVDGIQPGVPMPHSRIDVDLLATDAAGRPDLLERRLDSGYNAWWACLMPIEAVGRIGYMVPMFFQGDDAEFCYRARAHGIPTVTLPGAALWHTDFSLKDIDDVKIYFIRRNYLTVAALHGDLPIGSLIRKLGTELAQFLLGMRYGLAATVIEAIEDFLDGPDDLYDGGTLRLGEILALRARYPETICHPATAIPGIAPNDLAIVTSVAKPRHPVAFALGRALDHLRGRHRFAIGEIAHDEAHWWHVCLFRTAVVSDASQEGVRVRRRDRGLLLRLAWRATKVLWRFGWRGGAMRGRYQAALPDLTSRDTWTRLYRGAARQG